MSVYVSDMLAPFGPIVMCHMWADTRQELLAMADKIGVQRKELQQRPKASWVHFDIPMSKRVLAVKAGAIETDRFGPTEHLSKLDIASGDEMQRARGYRMLAAIESSRAPSRGRVRNKNRRLVVIDKDLEKELNRSACTIVCCETALVVRVLRMMKERSSPIVGKGDIHGGQTGMILYEQEWYSVAALAIAMARHEALRSDLNEAERVTR